MYLKAFNNNLIPHEFLSLSNLPTVVSVAVGLKTSQTTRPLKGNCHELQMD